MTLFRPVDREDPFQVAIDAKLFRYASSELTGELSRLEVGMAEGGHGLEVEGVQNMAHLPSLAGCESTLLALEGRDLGQKISSKIEGSLG